MTAKSFAALIACGALAAAASSAAATATPPAPAAPPAVFVLYGSADEALVLEPAATSDESGQDGGEAPPPKAPAVKKGAAYRVVDLKGAGPTVTASGDGKIGISGCGAGERPIVPFDKVPASEGAYVLVPGTWTAAPGAITTESAVNASYEKIATAALESSGVKAPKIIAGQAIKADFDGDGTEDLIFTAANANGDADPKVGDYSALIIQLNKAGKPVTIVPLVTLIDESNLEMAEGPTRPLNLVAIADIDGDGKMELVTYGQGAEEHYVDVWSLQADGTMAITYQAYCGV